MSKSQACNAFGELNSVPERIITVKNWNTNQFGARQGYMIPMDINSNRGQFKVFDTT